MNTTPNTVVLRQSGAIAAGATTVDQTALDLKGYGGVVWIVATASQASTGVCQLVAEGRDLTTDSWVDLPASVSHTSGGAETGNVFQLELVRPMKRYVRLSVRRSVANTAIDSILAILTDPTNAPLAPAGGTYVATFVGATA